MHRSLAIIIQNKFPDIERCQLSAWFRADRPGGGYKNGLVSEIGDDLFHRDFNFRVAQQVLDLDLTDRLLHNLASDNFVDRRGDQNLYRFFRTVFDQLILFVLRIVIGREKYGVDIDTIPQIFDVVSSRHDNL